MAWISIWISIGTIAVCIGFLLWFQHHTIKFKDSLIRIKDGLINMKDNIIRSQNELITVKATIIKANNAVIARQDEEIVGLKLKLNS